uniref:Peptidase S1 domain-containing protein n=1 Tax=Globisporangium ultimum (strain ATCC 200006 / CBS 805.95 / DAOM BR144) TaxID=431595 RepID=K3WIS1_GLOUD
MSNTNCAHEHSTDSAVLFASGRDLHQGDLHQGDSGGPLINLAGNLISVMSWCNRCDLAGYLGVWIEANAPGATFV